MKLVDHAIDKITIELTEREFDVINRALTATREEYEVIDPSIIDTSFEDVAAVDDAFLPLLKELNERRTRK